MGTIGRGVKNAFRNTIRTFSVTVILAMSIGLALVMLLSYQTVQAKITSVKSSIGNTISVSPAGARGFEGGGEPLTEDQMATIKGVAHVTGVVATLQDRLTAGSNNNLTSAIDAGTLGNRFGNQNRADAGGTAPAQPSTTETRTFTPPIQVNGLSDATSLTTGTSKLTAGELFANGSTDNVAIVGTALATKNNLSVGSTFTAYDQTITVKGIYDAGNEFSNAGLYFPISTLQTLSSQANDVSSATVTVDSIDNVSATTTAIQNAVGADKADVVSNQNSANSAIAPLQNIKSISMYSLIGALAAGAIITLLTMIMIVRERRREIGVLKAIGASNISVVMQFISESLVLTLMGSVLGVILGAALSNPILNALVTNAESSTTQAGGPGVRGVGRSIAAIGGGIGSTVQNLHATVGTDMLLYGLLAAVLVAIIGSAVPAFLIAKVRPAEVMRGE